MTDLLQDIILFRLTGSSCVEAYQSCVYFLKYYSSCSLHFYQSIYGFCLAEVLSIAVFCCLIIEHFMVHQQFK